MIEQLKRTVPCRLMTFQNGMTAHMQAGELTVTWSPDDPWATRCNIVSQDINVEAYIGIDLWTFAIETTPNGKFCAATAQSSVALASAPAMFGFRVDTEHGWRVIGHVLPEFVHVITAFYNTMVAMHDTGREMICEMMDAELEVLLLAGNPDDSGE